MQMHLEKYGTELEFKLSDIKTREEKYKIQHRMDEMDCYTPELVQFFQETSYRKMLHDQLSTNEECQARLYLLEGFDFAYGLNEF